MASGKIDINILRDLFASQTTLLPSLGYIFRDTGRQAESATPLLSKGQTRPRRSGPRTRALFFHKPTPKEIHILQRRVLGKPEEQRAGDLTLAKGCNSPISRVACHGTILGRRRTRQRRIASSPARCLEPVAPANGMMHRFTAQRHGPRSSLTKISKSLSTAWFTRCWGSPPTQKGRR